MVVHARLQPLRPKHGDHGYGRPGRKAILPNIDKVHDMESDASSILLVEKGVEYSYKANGEIRLLMKNVAGIVCWAGPNTHWDDLAYPFKLHVVGIYKCTHMDVDTVICNICNFIQKIHISL